MNRNLFRYGILFLSALATACHAGGSDSGAGAGTAQGCPDNDDLFRNRLWNPVLRNNCILCHTAGGRAEGSGFVLVNGDDTASLEKNEATFRKVAQLTENGEPLVVLKPTGRAKGGHGGGVRVQPGSPEEADLQLLASWMRGTVPQCKPPDSPSSPPVLANCQDTPGARMLRRLTHEEYRNTVHDLLGISADSVALAADVVVDNFANNAGALTVSSLLADQYRAAAESLAESAMQTNADALAPCHKTGGADCALSFVKSFGQRAFRRPLTTDELGRYRDFLLTTAASDGFDAGVQWTIAAMLQSPNFLYRSELGAKSADGAFALDSWEIASELSYLFWHSMPDDALFTAAKSGALLTPDGLKTQEDRLAADPRAAAAMAGFVEQWLHLDRLPSTAHDMTAYPEFNSSVMADMQGEARRYVQDLVQRKATLSDALTAKSTFLTDQLATFYGVKPGSGTKDAAGFRPASLDGTPYGGLLGLGAVLTTYSHATMSDPVHRGKLVRERFFCQDLPPPPSNVNASPPPVDPSKSTRERFAEHAQNTSCAVCHNLMDPIGFGFESFDGVGRFRTMDGTHPIDASGKINATDHTDGTFDGLTELQTKLAGSSDVEACFLRVWATYASGVAQNDALACALSRHLPQTDFSSIRYALASTANFRTRTGTTDDADAPWMGAPTDDPPASTTTPTPPPSGGTAPPPVTASGSVTLLLTPQSSWPTGVCENATVTNNGTSAVAWSVSHQLEGTITNIWNASASAQTGTTTFTGAGWNSSLDPGASATFGYCVSF